MWHEARRREKATQKLFNDHKKRAERRREENRVDPSSFLQVNGVKAKLCLDPNVYKQAATSMVAWQGDPKVTIDRFDVRATLESIPRDDTTRSRVKSKQTPQSGGVLDVDESKPMKTLIDYERYRLLIQNDLHGVSEGSRLDLVAKSDIISDAKLRKLKGNKFGTSGETPGSIDQPIHSRPQMCKDPARRVPTGPSYNSVPPPSSLTNSQSSSQSRSSWKNEQRTESPDIPHLAGQVIDLDDYDNFDPDQVDIRETSKHIGDVAKKYGLSNEELILLSRLDNKEVALKESIGELKILAKKSQIHNKLNTSQEVYGPALPPELANPKLNRILTGSPESSDNESDSPVPQRSPRGATMIPLRGESRVSSKESSDNEMQHRQAKAATTPPKAKSEPETVPIQVECPPNNEQISTKHEARPSPEIRRRASTPLAYKRNCRSSRSLSRERRKTMKDHDKKINSSSSPSPDRDEYRLSRRHRHEDRSRKRARDR